MGVSYQDLPKYRKGFDIEHGARRRDVLQDVPRQPANVIVNGQVLEVSDQALTIGRAEMGGHDRVSRKHAELRRGEDGTLYVRDLSANGTYLNGQKLPSKVEVPISPFDDLRLGRKDGPRLELRERPADSPVAPDTAPPAQAGDRAALPDVDPGQKPSEMRGGDFQERHWESLSDRQRKELTDRFSENQLFDPQASESLHGIS